ncbi:MAG: desulfoferrodoxin [Treponema sp.]|nr:desulfoferrodoxin [Treponema sp.]
MILRFYKCKKCGKIIAVIKGSPCDTMCCGEAMVELKANTTDAAVEKHVPVVQKNGNLVEVSVGSVAHPMEEKHYIEWISLETKEANLMKELKPGDEPKAVFALTDGDDVVRAYAYCNLHGLWADK